MAPAIDLLISREGATVEELAILSAEDFADAQLQDPDLIILRKWVKEQKFPTSVGIAGLGARAKELAQISNQTQLRENVLVLQRVEDPERKLILVPAFLEERIIRVLHDGVGASHQAAKATAVKVIKRFYWPGLKRDVKLYVAGCESCEEYLRHARTPKAGLRSKEVGGRGDCLAQDIVGGDESFPLTPHANKYILTLVNCFSSYALAIFIPDQSS